MDDPWPNPEVQWTQGGVRLGLLVVQYRVECQRSALISSDYCYCPPPSEGRVPYRKESVLEWNRNGHFFGEPFQQYENGP